MDTSEEYITVLSVCTGIRGLDRGVERVIGPCRTIAYVEIEAALIENLVVGMEAGVLAPAPVWSNLKTLPWRYFRGKIFLLMGGYPCQPFSTAGRRKGTDDPRHLWPHIERGIRTARPLCCFFENVAGHVSLGFDQVVHSLRAMGYAVEAGIYTAAEVGAPHKRARVFILAILADAKDHVRGLYQRQWRSGSAEVDFVGAGETMADSGGSERRQDNSGGRGCNEGDICERREKAVGPKECGEAMANSSIFSEREQNDKTDTESGARKAREISFFGSAAVANGLSQGLERRLQESDSDGAESEWRLQTSRSGRWPAGPGQEQYAWECSRTLEPGLGSNASRNIASNDILHLKNYEIYTSDKIRAIKTLSALWHRIDQEKNQWTAGGLFRFLEKEILFSDLHGAIQNKRLWHAISQLRHLCAHDRPIMRGMRNDQQSANSPQGQEYFEQLRREFADTMCILSYEITLAGRQEVATGCEAEVVQYLRDHYKDAWWDVPEALSEVQTAWKPLSEAGAWEKQIIEAYRSFRLSLYGTIFGYNFREDLLRALGNGVVEQQAEFALRDLLAKHFPV